jgi:uncharacterized membrane protein YhiD involved in acid resistance
VIVIIGLVICGYVVVRMIELATTETAPDPVRVAAGAMALLAMIGAGLLIRAGNEVGSAMQQLTLP